jgi:hypothetical protein
LPSPKASGADAAEFSRGAVLGEVFGAAFSPSEDPIDTTELLRLTQPQLLQRSRCCLLGSSHLGHIQLHAFVAWSECFGSLAWEVLPGWTKPQLLQQERSFLLISSHFGHCHVCAAIEDDGCAVAAFAG